MKTSSNAIYTTLESKLTDTLLQAGRIVHHTKQTHPHIVTTCKNRFLSLEVDKYSNKTPEVVVISLNRNLFPISLPKTIQKKWDIYKAHDASEVILLLTVAQAHQVVSVIDDILHLMEKKEYSSIKPVLPFRTVDSEYLHRISTPEADQLLGC